jgi:hypothetical protein
MLGRPSADQTILSCWSHTWQKKTKKKKQNSKTLSLKPLRIFTKLVTLRKQKGSSTARCWLQTGIGNTDKQDWMQKE